jgi:RNA polymerase sigma-70 factor (ECF subfamily)
MVFNLFVFDEFKHHEIADKLNISVNTSKSQLAHAKKILQFKINQVNAFGHEKFTK